MERLPVLLHLGGYPKAFSARTGKRQADLENDVVGEFPDVTAKQTHRLAIILKGTR